MESLIDAYCAAWSEADAGRRAAMLGEVWAESGTYTDPRVHTTGIAELVAFIGSVLAGRPGARVIRTSNVDAHHGLARFLWRVVRADGTTQAEGIDFAEIDEDGRLLRIVGFFGPLTRS